MRDVKGLGYIASLLASPGRDLHVLELVSAATGQPPGARADGDLVVLDAQAKQSYARRLQELEEELEQARD